MINNIDYIICPICNKKVKRLATNGHLRIHNITSKELLKKYPNQKMFCENYSKKLSNSQIGKTIKESTKLKISKANKGNLAWNKRLTKAIDERIKKYGKNVSKTRLRKLKNGEMLHNSLGQKRTKKSRLLMSKAHIGQTSNKKGKTFEQIYGKSKAIQIKNILRLHRINQILKNGLIFPAYNKKAIEFFKVFDKKNNTNGQYATNPKEYCINSLGYWVDYINFDKKIIMEYDEKHHYNNDGNLRNKDIQRQQKIQKNFPDFDFVRIKGEDVLC